MTQSDILLKHLSTVFDPELGANIVELGMVKDVQHVDKTVTIKLALTSQSRLFRARTRSYS